jgi:hypothetical protein
MVTEAEQTRFNFAVIREGLNAIASPSIEQLLLNKKGLEYLDDVFDPMPLDYLPWLIEKNEISQSFAIQFRGLYQNIEKSIGHLEWQEEDAFIKKDEKELENWRKVAKCLLGELDSV